MRRSSTSALVSSTKTVWTDEPQVMAMNAEGTGREDMTKPHQQVSEV